MPVKIPGNLPAIELLEKENMFVMSDLRAAGQDIRTLKVLILNLTPIKTRLKLILFVCFPITRFRWKLNF